MVTPGNVDDRKPITQLAKRLFGKLLRGEGYLSRSLLKQLHQEFRIALITPHRKNMKVCGLPLLDKLLHANERLSRQSSTDSRTSRRASTRAIALRSTSSSIWCVV
jgi:hypothetical protein